MKDSTIVTRTARPEDLATILGLYRDLDDSHRALDGTLRLRDDRARREQIASAPYDNRTRLAVAAPAGRVLGFVLASFAHRRPDVIISAIAVAARERRKGIGTALIHDVEEWAKTKRARFIELDVYEFNPEALAFYERCGYLTTSRTMRKDPSFYDLLSFPKSDLES